VRVAGLSGAVDGELGRHRLAHDDGAGLTQQIAVSHKPGDLGDQYNSFLDCEEIDPATARKVYANAKLSPTYAGWPYRAVLEQRMVEADANVAGFRAGTGTAMMGRSAYSCMACHQAR
jgi:hypothetical protein